MEERREKGIGYKGKIQKTEHERKMEQRGRGGDEGGNGGTETANE